MSTYGRKPTRRELLDRLDDAQDLVLTERVAVLFAGLLGLLVGLVLGRVMT